MDSVAASRLAGHLTAQQQTLCEHVSARLLRAFPELTHALRLEENYSPTARLSEVAVGRLNELVRAVLLFELPNLADKELGWAGGVLPRSGVTFQHQSAMIRWFFEEVRRLPLSAAEQHLSFEVEQHFLGVVNETYRSN
jgi:hypothetical protein